MVIPTEFCVLVLVGGDGETVQKKDISVYSNHYENEVLLGWNKKLEFIWEIEMSYREKYMSKRERC